MVRSATTEDATRICEIYNHYVLRSTITFEEQPVLPDEMKQRIAEVLTGLPWLVRVEDQVVQGFAYASKWKGRLPIFCRIHGLPGRWLNRARYRDEAALCHGMQVENLNDLDLSYTPPLSSPWDPVQTAAQAWSEALREECAQSRILSFKA